MTIKKMLKGDKRHWKRQQVRQEMHSKEKWAGLKLLNTEFKPKLYAKRDKNGNFVPQQRAQATAEYLAEEQWKCKEPRSIYNVVETVSNDLRRRRNQEAKLSINDGLITIEELESIIKKLARGKVPEPDDIPTDWLKDLDSENEWWEVGRLPREVGNAEMRG